MENHTAKLFALQLGSLLSLYLSLSFLLVLLFGIINLAFPDAVDTYWQVESASSMVRLGIAMVIVFYPTYLILTRFVNNNRRSNKNQQYLGLTKWLIYLSLLAGGMVLLGNLVAIIMTFLEGEITTRFLLKATAFVVVIGAAFTYYVFDARGYWLKQEKQSVVYAAIASIVVALAIGFGFAHIATPGEVREQRLDETQLNDLRSIQWQIEEYLLIQESIPESLAVLSTTIPLPQAPADRPDYRYEVTEDGFSLCATFTTSSPRDEFRSFAQPLMKPESATTPYIVNPENWEHGTGEVCFSRVVRGMVDDSE